MKIRKGFVSNSSSTAFIIRTEKNVRTIKHELLSLLDTYNLASGEDLTFDEVFREPDDFDKIAEKDRLMWYVHDWKSIEGDIIVYSTSDNTIPWGIQEFICDVYSCTRLHLG